MIKEEYNQKLANVGNQIRILRKRKGYTQERFAERLEVSCITISRIENGTTPMNILMLLKMAAALEASVEEILQQ